MDISLAVTPKGPANAPRLRPSSLLACATLTLLLVSLALPAASVTVPFPPASTFYGAQAVWFLPFIATSFTVDAVQKHEFALAHLALLTLALSALSNLVFALPLLWFKRSRVRSPSRGALIACALGVTLAIASPLAARLTGLDISVRFGYGVWLAAWFALGAALLAARHETAATTP